MRVVSPKPVVRQCIANQHHVLGDSSPAFGPRLSIITHKNYNEAHFILCMARINSVAFTGLRERPVYLDVCRHEDRGAVSTSLYISQSVEFSGKVQEPNEGHICPFICRISKTNQIISINIPIVLTHYNSSSTFLCVSDSYNFYFTLSSH